MAGYTTSELRMALGAEDHVRITDPGRRQEMAQLAGRDVAVAVDEPEVPASALSQADAQRGPLALVLGRWTTRTWPTPAIEAGLPSVEPSDTAITSKVT